MDFGQGSNANGSGDDPEASDSRKGKKLHHRHDVHQIQQLEAYFKESPHPNENQRLQLSKELGLEPKQVKFWFQNKRTQIKFLNERADSSALRVENGRIQSENNTFRRALNNALCSACSDPHFDKEERRRSVEKLRKENAHLKQEHERLSNTVAKFIGKPVYPTQSMLAAPASSLDLPAEGVWGLGMAGPSLDLDLDIVSANPNDPILAHQLNGIQEMDKSLLVETAASAMDELMKLLQVNEPVWIKSPAGERYVLHSDTYGKFFPGANHLKSSGTRIVSSKSSGVVMMNGTHLFGMFLDSSKWVDLFPTIVTQARTMEVLDTRMLGNQGASLQLMYVQMHILSPLVVPREFYFLRYCRQLEPGNWVVADLPYDCSKVNPPTPPLNYWGLPSGCMIQDMSNGYSMVTWVEHVEVDYQSLNHRLYTELVRTDSAYAAERWVVTLQRMCEKSAYSIGIGTHSHELGGVIGTPEGRRSILKLSHRMVKDFCSMLSMSGGQDLPHLSELYNSGIRVTVRKSDGPGQPSGMVVSSATSLWLPLSCENLFNFFRDKKMRAQWDVLSNYNPVREIANISSRTYPGNRISVIQPFIPTESNMLMLQESCVDSLGSLVVYAPVDATAIKSAIIGEDSTNVPILPSGFMISSDGRPDKGTKATGGRRNSRAGGSVLTVAFQILVCSLSSSKRLKMESVATVNTLVSSAIQKIKATLECSNMN